MRRKDRIGRGGAIRILPRFRIVSLSSAVCAAVRYRSGAEIQNLSESIRLVVFSHVQSYILIIRRDSRAILNAPRDLSLFEYRRSCSEERVDPRWNIKIFQKI